MKTVIAILLIVASTAISPALSQPQPADRPGMDAVSRHLVPPEIIMSHQAELGVSDEQRLRLQQIMSSFQADIVELQWQQQAESARLGEHLMTRPIDTTAALEQLDRLMAVEDAIKRRHFALLIQIKNELSPEQLDRIEEMRSRP